MEQFIGKIITHVFLSEHGDLVEFELENGEPLYIRCSGECCNPVWVNHITGLNYLIGHKIQNVRDNQNDSSYDGEDEVFVLTFTTTFGHCDFEIRNGPGETGYGYSGSFSLVDLENDGWAVGHIQESSWKEITEDM